ncbi:MAG: cytochrome c3 family protein [Deltaproteobacteria bacterium]|nr:cytochrome c3 family protein [Deltaproteobacteria bacterium]
MKRINYPLIISVLLVIAAGYVYSQWTSYHDFEGKCLDCHLTVPGKGETPQVFAKDITLMCKGCHKDEQQLSHPVDLKPSMQVPAKFPLDWKGQITCVTCHPVHDQGFGEFHLRSKSSGESFCTMCHNNLENELHKISVGSAHVSRSTSTKYIETELGNILDELSIKCLACHDATFAGDTLVENFTVTNIFHNSNSIGVSHPIGISYAETKRKYLGAYRNVSELPSEIKLFGGLVGCGSCHNPYSKQHSELVMSNEKSALCLACHVK